MTDILIAIDGSAPSEKALDFAFANHAEANLTAVSILDPSALMEGSADLILPDTETWRETAEKEIQEVLDEAAHRADEVGLDLSTDIAHGAPARAIVNYADEHGFDQIIVGSHGRDGVSRVLLGSVAETVVRRSSVPVTVVR